MEEEKNNSLAIDSPEEIITLIVNIFIVVITLYLVLIYCRSKDFRNYPCSNNIILSIVILIDNAVRLIRFPNISFICYTQSFLLSFFDKLVLTALTTLNFLTFLGVLKRNFYVSHEKIIFYVSHSISFLLSLIMTIIFWFLCYVENENVPYCYPEPSGDKPKKIIDTIFTLCLFSFDIFCILKLLLFLSESIKEVSDNNINDLNFQHHYITTILTFIFNEFMFLIVILIINNKLFVPDQYIDLVYVSSCFLVDAYYSFNKTIFKETLKIFCGKKNAVQLRTNDSFLSEEDKISRTSSLSN